VLVLDDVLVEDVLVEVKEVTVDVLVLDDVLVEDVLVEVKEATFDVLVLVLEVVVVIAQHPGSNVTGSQKFCWHSIVPDNSPFLKSDPAWHKYVSFPHAALGSLHERRLPEGSACSLTMKNLNFTTEPIHAGKTHTGVVSLMLPLLLVVMPLLVVPLLLLLLLLSFSLHSLPMLLILLILLTLPLLSALPFLKHSESVLLLEAMPIALVYTKLSGTACTS